MKLWSELADAGVFDESRYMDVSAEFAKAGPTDIFIRYTVTNRGPEAAPIHILPQIWFRNGWSWECNHERDAFKPVMRSDAEGLMALEHPSLGDYSLLWEPHGSFREVLFTENVTNDRRVFGAKVNREPYVKDAFHRHVIDGEADVVNPLQEGTKAALHHVCHLELGESVTLRLRLVKREEQPAPNEAFEEANACFELRQAECDRFYNGVVEGNLTPEEREIVMQAYAGLLCSKQFYHYVVEDWLKGEPAIQTSASDRDASRNAQWKHLYSRDIISMPDKWEYPWFAAWDLAFHLVPMAKVDPGFAKHQLILFLREWYMHPNGQIPAYEFKFDDVNPPVHAWAARRVYEVGKDKGEPDRDFLTSVFQKLLLNFTWWVNRKDDEGNSIFSGGFLGLDNISVFDRSSDIPLGGRLQQADGTAWMGFFCSNMLQMALALATDGEKLAVAYEDMASKFFEHFVQIVDAMNTHGGTGLWDEFDGFYYDQVLLDHEVKPIKLRSLVGLLPLIAVSIVDEEQLEHLPGFRRRFEWFLKNRRDLARYIVSSRTGKKQWLISTVPFQRLQRVLSRLIDPHEFLSPYGIRSLSKFHESEPYSFSIKGQDQVVHYVPGESKSLTFGGNSNWRGPIWFPANHLLIEALRTYHRFYGRRLVVQDPETGAGEVTLDAVAALIVRRLTNLFRMRPDGRPVNGGAAHYREDPHWKDLVLFHEYFHAETGRGLGASHQTGWTSLTALYFDEVARERPPRLDRMLVRGGLDFQLRALLRAGEILTVTEGFS